MHPEVPLNRTTTLLTIGGAIEPTAFERAFARLVARHEALRSTIENTPDGLRYYVRKSVDAKIDVVDFSTHDDPQAAYRDWLRKRCIKVFDDGNQQFDAALVKLAERCFVFYLNQNHLMTDGGSCIVLHEDLGEFYLAELDGTAAESELDATGSRPYSAFIELAGVLADSLEAAESDAFWSDRFAIKPPSPRFYGRSGALRRALSARVRRPVGPALTAR